MGLRGSLLPWFSATLPQAIQVHRPGRLMSAQPCLQPIAAILSMRRRWQTNGASHPQRATTHRTGNGNWELGTGVGRMTYRSRREE